MAGHPVGVVLLAAGTYPSRCPSTTGRSMGPLGDGRTGWGPTEHVARFSAGLVDGHLALSRGVRAAIANGEGAPLGSIN